MKVELSKEVEQEEAYPFPCILKRGSEILLAHDDYSEGTILKSPSFDVGEVITNTEGSWMDAGWTMYEGTVTLSNK